MPTEEASNIVVTLVVAAAAVVVAYILGTIVSIVVRRAGRRSEFVRDVSHRMRRPLRAVLVVLALYGVVFVNTSANVFALNTADNVFNAIVGFVLLVTALGADRENLRALRAARDDQDALHAQAVHG